MLIVKMGTREEDLKMKKTRRKKILIIKMETREREGNLRIKQMKRKKDANC